LDLIKVHKIEREGKPQLPERQVGFFNGNAALIENKNQLTILLKGVDSGQFFSWELTDIGSH
jgi:hypothetical protein